MTAEAHRLPAEPPPTTVGRYRLAERFDARGAVERWVGEDDESVRVVVLSETLPTAAAKTWPSIAWETELRRQANDLGLAAVRERFEHAGRAYLVLDVPAGVTLWDV